MFFSYIAICFFWVRNCFDFLMTLLSIHLLLILPKRSIDFWKHLTILFPYGQMHQITYRFFFYPWEPLSALVSCSNLDTVALLSSFTVLLCWSSCFLNSVSFYFSVYSVVFSETCLPEVSKKNTWKVQFWVLECLKVLLVYSYNWLIIWLTIEFKVKISLRLLKAFLLYLNFWRYFSCILVLPVLILKSLIL